MIKGIVSAHSEQGVRAYQEDYWVSKKKKISNQESGWLLAVMDGHGGSATAEFCVKNLESFFDRSVSAKRHVDEDVLKETIGLLNENTRQMRAGSTLSLVFISETNSRALVAILGDSPVIILDQKDKTITSPEHNVRTNIFEREVAVARGAYYDQGYIWVGGRGLQMARALGDNDLGGVLSREPEIYKVDLGPNSFVIVASDGVFDPGHSETGQQIRRLTRMIKTTSAFDAEDLVNDALARHTGDNATAIIWKASEKSSNGSSKK